MGSGGADNPEKADADTWGPAAAERVGGVPWNLAEGDVPDGAPCVIVALGEKPVEAEAKVQEEMRQEATPRRVRIQTKIPRQSRLHGGPRGLRG